MQPETSDLGDVLTDDAVLRYLAGNPEFFVNNQDILPRLRIPHDTGKAVSLIEKQVSVLRSKCGTLENSLRDLIAVARENENLHQRLHGLIQDVISATTLAEIVALTRTSLQQNFNADDVHLLLVADKPKRVRKSSAAKPVASKAAAGKAAPGKVARGKALEGKAAHGKASSKTASKTPSRNRNKRKPIEGMRVLRYDDKSIALFAELFDNGETVCGLPSAEHLSCFVGNDYANIASAALIPLQHERQLGVVMLTSRDESRFSSGKGVMFLNQLGQLLSRRLQTYGVIEPEVGQ